MAAPDAKSCSREENERIKYAVSCMKGTRDEMQEYHAAILQLDGSDSTSLFAVFDGHGGDKVALYCSKQFPIELVNDPDYQTDPRTAMEYAYSRTCKKFQELNESRKSYSPDNSNMRYKGPQNDGITACVVLIKGNQIIVRNDGDFCCFLSRNGQAIDLSTDHKLPREIGLTTAEQKMTCNPDIHTENITSDADFLLIASDGIWNDAESQHVVDFVKEHLKSGAKDLCVICARVIDTYNVSTVILIQFKNGALVSSKSAEFDGSIVPDEMWYEILVRLPSKVILRCRAVCKQWRNITTAPKFLQEHHSQQKLQLIVPVHYSSNKYSCLHRVLAFNLQCLDDEFRTIIKSTTFGKYKARLDEDEDKCILSLVHASLDGLLLLTFDKTCYIANPATRKASHLPSVDTAGKVLGLYKHAPSEEYRVLYQRAEDEDEEGGPDEEDLESFCILSLASQDIRGILLDTHTYGRLVFAMDGQPPAVVGDRIYWAPSTFEKQITVFDTEAEVFHWMDSPSENTTHSVIKLIELKGKLALSSSRRGASKVELFILEDSESQSWVRSDIVELPVAQLQRRFESFFVSLDKDIVIESVWRDGDRDEKSPGQLLYCDQYGELDKLCGGYWGTSPVHILKENITPHSFLNDSTPLFEGL